MLIVFGQAPLPVEPTKGSFDNPTLGQHLESMEVRTLDDFDQVAEHRFAPIDDALFVTAIDQDFA